MYIKFYLLNIIDIKYYNWIYYNQPWQVETCPKDRSEQRAIKYKVTFFYYFYWTKR